MYRSMARHVCGLLLLCCSVHQLTRLANPTSQTSLPVHQHLGLYHKVCCVVGWRSWALKEKQN